MGGASTRRQNSDSSEDKVYEIEPDTLLDISSGGVSSIGATPTGIGGFYERLFTCDQAADKSYELDPDTMLDISSGGVASPDTSVTGIGGI